MMLETVDSVHSVIMNRFFVDCELEVNPSTVRKEPLRKLTWRCKGQLIIETGLLRAYGQYNRPDIDLDKTTRIDFTESHKIS